MSKDSVKCFEYLYQDVPSWITTLSRLEKTIDERPKEYIRARAPSLPSKQRSGSAETLHDGQINTELSPSIAARSPSLQPQTPRSPLPNPSSQVTSPVEPQQYFQPRKRKPASTLSIGGRSGPTKYRSRSLLVVYYDGDVQKTFEELVRYVGTGRNWLRKGKLAARLEALAEMAPKDSDDEGHDESDDDDPDFKGMHKIQFTPRSTRMPNSVPNGPLGPRKGTASAPAIYDQLDKALERTQMMCEKAAHQYLRDGDCRLELREAKKHLEETRALVEPAFTALHEKKKESAEPEKKLEEAPKPDEGSKLDLTKVPTTDQIEVDDHAAGDSDDDIDIKLSFPRANRRTQVEIATY
ncbi:MAG: hypothetical protein M1822_006227 [Bathelium mastoideum]|nr:MAG: hypothetical protein M1822_006227 [Bathelium mastoideum]